MAQVYNRTFSPEKWDKVNPRNKSIIKDYTQELKAQKKAQGTIYQYENDLKIVAIYVLDNLENKSFLELSKRDFRNFVIYCQDSWNLSTARINRLLSSIRTILAFCEDDDEVYEDYDRSAAAKIKGLPKEKVRDVVFIPNDVIEKLYDKLIGEQRYKEATLLAILYESGCRRNEVAQIRRDSITENGNATNFVIGKRAKKFRCLYFSRTKKAFRLYEEQIARTDEDKIVLLFGGPNGENSEYDFIYNSVKKWANDLKVITGTDEYGKLNVHSFRHCFVENLMNGTHYFCKEFKLGKVPLEKVKTLAHHESSDTTLRYADNNEEKDIAELFGISL